MAVTGLTLTEEERTRFVRRNTALLSGAQASIWITVGVFVAAGPIAIVQLTGRASLGGLLFALWAMALGAGAQSGGLLMGWSGTYLGGTTVISDITTSAERGTALGFTDLLSAGAGAVGALSAGIVLDISGLSALGASMGALLVGVIILLVLVPRTSWRAGVAAATTP